MVDTFERQYGLPSTIESSEIHMPAKGVIRFADVKPVVDPISEKIMEIVRGEREVTPEAAAKQAAFRVSQQMRQTPIVGYWEDSTGVQINMNPSTVQAVSKR